VLALSSGGTLYSRAWRFSWFGAGVFLLAICNATRLALAEVSPAVPATILQAILAQRLPRDAVSMSVLDLEADRVVFALNSDVPRNPASTIKLLTTYAGLDMLGPAYTWHTRAYVRGEWQGSLLKGDLVLKGGGDPFMTLERWWSFARALRNKGLKTIRGDIVIDATAFSLPTADPGAFDGRPHRAYNVVPDALMVNFQTVQFRLVPNSQTHSVDVETDPAPPNLSIENRIRYASGRCSGAARRVDFDVPTDRWDRVVLSGALSQACAPRSFTRVLLSPSEYAFGTFVALWRQMGGEFDGKLRVAPVPADAEPYLSYDSLSLGEIVRLTNKFSSNLMARHLLLTLGSERYGAPATLQKGADAMAEWGKSRGISLEHFDIDNGSGLSRSTRITTSAMAKVLSAAYHSRYAPEFMTSLPLAGIDGTMRGKLRETPAGAVRLKSGHLNDVNGIAGFVSAASGRTYAVVSIVNHPRAVLGAGDPVHTALVDWVIANL
jgi:serine-type D-Ala-D-Ala carboxypeptidase/endopeptidase (penicillin-binding protein 4)